MFKTLLMVLFFIPLFSSSYPVEPIENKKSLIEKMEVFCKREGLPNIFHKIETQKQIRIAYIGGSITAATEGWRDITFDWFRINYPFNAFYQINSTVGGTGSLLGVFRLDEVLKQKPDLIFVEFAVNDANETADNRRVQSMEGIVRKTWETLPNTDICFVYTTAVKFCIPLMEEGKQYDAVTDHEKVANHYGIPSIDMGLEVAKLVEKGKILLTADPKENAQTTVFFSDKDHYHPLKESGHPVYAATVIRSLRKMSKNSKLKNHDLPVPLVSDNWQVCSMVFPGQAELQGDWTKFPDNQKDQFGQVPGLYRGKPGAVMKFAFEGNELGLYDCIGPGTGKIEITVDDKKYEFQRFDHNCRNWRRHSIFMNKLNDGFHKVEIKVTGEKFDKSLIVKPNPDDDPAIYAGFDWYPVGVLIVGKLKKQ